MKNLEEKIGYVFKNEKLLQTALSHSSYVNESHNRGESYERLEFLGDSILGFVTADFLYRQDPKIPEGTMTRLRSELVCESSLHKVALELNLDCYMLLGKGEEHTGGRKRVSVLADMVESIIAAIYLDSGLEEAKRFIESAVLSHAESLLKAKGENYKSELQEYLQKNGAVRIVYEEVSEFGPDHDKSFVSRVLIDGLEAGTGEGKTKKEAEQEAAGNALKCLKEQGQ